MGNYTQHAAEALALVQAFQKATVWDTRTTLTPGMDDVVASEAKERERCAKQVPAYFEARRPYFAALLEAMDAILSGSDGSKWNSAIAGMEQNRQNILGKMLDGFDKASDQFKKIQAQIYEEERVFIEAFGAMEVYRRFGDIYKTLMKLQEFDTVLRGNYKDILDKMSSINELQENQSAQLLVLLGNTNNLITRREADNVVELSTALAKLGQLTSDVNSKEGLDRVRNGEPEIWDKIGRALDAFAQTSREARWLVDQVNQFYSMLRSAQDAEQRIHPIFFDLRQQTANYLKPPPNERADALCTDCERALADQAAKQTPGARVDLNEIGGELIDKADVVVAKIKSAYDAFKSEHSGRFFDTPNDKTLEELLRKSKWATRWKQIDDLKAPSSFSNMRDRASRFFDVDLVGAYTKLATAIQSRKPDIANAPDPKSAAQSIVAGGEYTGPDPVRDKLAESMTARQNALSTKIDSCQRELTSALAAVCEVLAKSDLTTLYQRTTLESTVRSG